LTVILKNMYLKPFKNFTYLVVFQNRASSPLWRKQTKRWSRLKAAFVTWTFRLPPVFRFEPFLSIYRYYMFFFSSLKLQYCRTIVLLNFSKKPLFQFKRRWSCDFPSRETPVAQKHRAISRQEKKPFSTPPVGLSCDFSPPPTESVRADVRWRHNQNFSDR